MNIFNPEQYIQTIKDLIKEENMGATYDWGEDVREWERQLEQIVNKNEVNIDEELNKIIKKCQDELISNL